MATRTRLTTSPTSNGLPGFLRCRAQPIAFDPSAPTTKLWQAHSAAMKLFGENGRCSNARLNLLDLKANLAERLAADCILCPRRCRVRRDKGERGYCQVGWESHFAHDFLHLGEDLSIIPAYSLFLGGCTIRCVYCRKWKLLESPDKGPHLGSDFPARVRQAVSEGAASIKLLGGTPEPHLHNLLRALRNVDQELPVVWESTMYISHEALEMASGVVDLFLANLRYGNDKCAADLSAVGDYTAWAFPATLKAKQFARVWVRHLVLPGHLECCTRPIVEWCADHFALHQFALLFQYSPHYEAWERPDLARRLSSQEMAAARRMVKEAFARK